MVRAQRAAAPHRWWAGRADDSFAAHLSVTRSVDRCDLRARARERDIATSVRFDPPDHIRPGSGRPERGLPVMERACAEVVAFPCHAFLSEGELDAICEFLSETNCS